MKTLRGALEAARPPAASLHDVAERDRQLAISFLDIQIAEHESSGFQRGNPSLALGEAIFGVIALMTRPFAPVAERAASAIARLTALPDFLDGARRSIAGPVPDAWRRKCLRECHGASILLGDGIPRWIAGERIDGALARHLSVAADAARAAVDEYQTWLETSRAAHGDDGCGSELFDLLLTRGHWCDRSRASLLTDARTQLDEALTRLDERARQIAAGGWPEVQHRLLDAHPAVEEYLPAYQRDLERLSRSARWRAISSPGRTRRSAMCRSRFRRAMRRLSCTTCTTDRRRRSIVRRLTITWSRRSKPGCRLTSSSAGCAPRTPA